VRDFLLPVVSGIDLVGERIADQLSELAVSYRNSALVENSGGGRVRAGDRAPDAELRDENGQARRLFELFREPRHILLLFLGAGFDVATQAEQVSRAIGDLPSDLIDSYRIIRGEGNAAAELRDVSGLAHSAYGLFDGGLVLVRPDGYVGYRSDNFDPGRFSGYLKRLFS
jgi:hypothetical protein